MSPLLTTQSISDSILMNIPNAHLCSVQLNILCVFLIYLFGRQTRSQNRFEIRNIRFGALFSRCNRHGFSNWIEGVFRKLWFHMIFVFQLIIIGVVWYCTKLSIFSDIEVRVYNYSVEHDTFNKRFFITFWI